MTTCPDCGARNTAGAPWCTQCLRPLDDEPAGAPDATDSTPTPASPPSDVAAPAPPAPPGGGDRPFRSADGRVEWRCEACEAWNDLEVPVCAVCGHRLGASVTGGGADQVAARVGRARTWLWGAAALGGVLLVVAVVLLVGLVRSGAVG